MKHSIVSLGTLAIATAATQAAYTPRLSSPQDTGKSWTVLGSVRGFYDDNYNARPDGPGKRDSLGFEISPEVRLNLPGDNTTFSAGYKYSMRYYEDRAQNSADHSHEADITLDHAFNERYRFDLRDSFVISQEPAILQPGAAVGAGPLRSNGDNVRNTLDANFHADLTTSGTGLRAGYRNDYYNYKAAGVGSYSSLLDRFEHTGTLELNHSLSESTIGLIGYKYSVVDHTSKDFVVAGQSASSRDNRAHTYYLGAEHKFTSELSGSLRAGAQTVNYSGPGSNRTSPYVDAGLNLAYGSGSLAQLGFLYASQQTDIGGANDSRAATVYGNILHRFTPRLSTSLIAQYQNVDFRSVNVGAINSSKDQMFLFGANVAFEINKFLTAEAGYNYDDLSSDFVARGYDRNRLYIGLRAKY